MAHEPAGAAPNCGQPLIFSGVKPKKTKEKHVKYIVFFCFPLFLFVFCWLFKGVSMNFCKGRIWGGLLEVFERYLGNSPLAEIHGNTFKIPTKNKQKQRKTKENYIFTHFSIVFSGLTPAQRKRFVLVSKV